MIDELPHDMLPMAANYLKALLGDEFEDSGELAEIEKCIEKGRYIVY